MNSERFLKRFRSTEDARMAEDAASKLRRIYKDALKVSNEKLLIMTDSGKGKNNAATMLAYAYHTVAQDQGLDSEIIVQKPKGRNTEISPEILDKLKTLPRGSSMMQCVSNRLGTLNGLGKSFRKFARARDHKFTSASSLGNLDKDHFNTLVDAHNYNYRAMKRKQEKLKRKLDDAKEVNITTPAGTDVFLGIEKSKAVFNHGIYDKKGHGGNLPAGEIYIPINRRSAYGKVVIDGSSRQKDRTVNCENDPMNIYFDGGIVKRITGGKAAKGLENTYRWAERKAKHPWGIRMAAELGIGLNEKSRVVGATILDEKAKDTAHIATGSNYWFGGDIKAIIHLDQVFKNPTIRVDGKRLKI